jgi:hypothetical protein
MKKAITAAIIILILSLQIAGAATTQISGSWLTDKLYKTVTPDGSIYYTQESGIVSKFLKLSLSAPETINVYYSWGGRCGSGTSNSYSYTTSSGRTSYGTAQISCSSASPEADLRSMAINYASPSTADTVFVNGALYQVPSPISIAPVKADLLKTISVIGAPIQRVEVNIPFNLKSSVIYNGPIDIDSKDGTFEQLYAAWFLLDINLNIIKSSEFTKIQNSIAYTTNQQLVPYNTVYFYVTVIDKQDFKYDGSWKMTEKIVTTDVQQIIIQSTPVITATPTPSPTLTPTPLKSPVITSPKLQNFLDTLISWLFSTK